MSFVKSGFHFLVEFVLGNQIMDCPKYVYSSHNQPEILPAMIFRTEVYEKASNYDKRAKHNLALIDTNLTPSKTS